MKKLILSVLAVALIAMTFVACSGKKEPLTEYTIVGKLSGTTLTAEMTVDYYNDTESELDELCFHLYGNAYRQGAAHSPIAAIDVSSAYPNGLSYGHMKVSEVTKGEKKLEFSIDDKNDVLCVKIDRLMPSDRTQITIKFELGLAEVRHRLGYYNDKYNLGNWYPVLCSFRQGEWVKHPYYSNGDPFDSKVSNYHVRLEYPSELTAASTGGEGKDGVLDVSIERVRDFAVVLGKFNVKTVTEGKTQISWYSEGSDDYTDVAALALKTYNELFGEYPFPTLAVVKTAFLSGGMEYPGLVYISDALNDEMIKEVIAHELAHQWWYSQVGNDQVNEAWLDEGLAEYSTTIFYEKNPSLNVTRDDRIADSLTTYMLYCELYKDNGKSVTKMDKCVNDYATNMEYTYMTYVKGQLLFDCLRSLIGDEAFFDGLKTYYSTNKFKVATKAELIGAFEKHTKYPLSSWVGSWVDGTALMFSVH